MGNSFNRSVVNTIVSKAIHGLKSDPERTTRNLVDMALQFADSRIQKEFYSAAQSLLSNEKSCYYDLIKETITQINEETLLTFSMNLGYDGLYEGTKRIRGIEQKEHFHIPWTISMALPDEELPERYHQIIDQGEKLGVLSWNLYSHYGVQRCVRLAQKHQNCTFIIFCSSDEVDDSILEEAERLRNAGFLVSFDKYADGVCDLLRSSGILYGLYHVYTDNDVSLIESGELLHDMEQLHPTFSVLIPHDSCKAENRRLVKNWVAQSRFDQQYKTIPWDLYNDTLRIDSVISEQAIWVGFDQYGHLVTDHGVEQSSALNIFTNDLSAILKQAFTREEILSNETKNRCS